MIDAAMLWDDETAYFFRGGVFYRFDIGPDVVSAGYPHPILQDWPRWPGNWTEVGAAVLWPNGRVYFFRGSEYLAFDLQQDTVLPGYPQSIASGWRGWPSHWSGVDAAVVWPNGKAYFFRGQEYLAFDIAQDTVLPGYPQPIASGWTGWPGDFPDVDAAVVWPNGRAYFFRGEEYLAFDIAKDTVLPGYPQATAAGWRGLPAQ